MSAGYVQTVNELLQQMQFHLAQTLKLPRPPLLEVTFQARGDGMEWHVMVSLRGQIIATADTQGTFSCPDAAMHSAYQSFMRKVTDYADL